MTALELLRLLLELDQPLRKPIVVVEDGWMNHALNPEDIVFNRETQEYEINI